jgi:predicted Ser/Thr protein kinase
MPYPIYNPETALDTGTGGAGKLVLKYTNIAEDLQSAMQIFNPEEPVDPQSVYKMLYSLTDRYKQDLDHTDSIGAFTGLDDFVRRLTSSDQATAKAAQELINIELKNVEEAMVLNSGLAFGKARALYYHGFLGEEEVLEMGLDEIATRIKGSNTENFSLFLQGVINGAKEAKYRINELGIEALNPAGEETADKFTAFINSIIEESQQGAKLKGFKKEKAMEDAFNKVLEDAEFGLVHTDAAAERYSVSTLMRATEEFNDFITQTVNSVKPGSGLYNRLLGQSEYAAYDINVNPLMPDIEQALKSLNINGNDYDLGTANSKMNRALNELAEMKRRGYADPKRINKILEEAEINVATQELAGIHSSSMKLAFAQDAIAQRREELQTAAREVVHGSIFDFVNKADNPGNITSAMESYFLRVMQLQTSASKDDQKLGQVLDGLLVYGQDFFGQGDRLALDEMYIHARNQLTFNATAGVAEQEGRISNFISMFDHEGETLTEKLRNIFSLHGEADLLERDPYKRTYREDYLDSDFGEYSGEALPEIRSRATGETIPEFLGEDSERMFEDFVQLHISGDQENTAKLIMRKRFADDPEAAKAYIDELKMIGMRYESKSAEISPKVAEMLEQFMPDIDMTMPMTTSDILETFDRSIGTLAEDEAAAVRSALREGAETAGGATGGDIPFKGIGEMISDHFPRIGRIGNRIGEHKFAIAGTVAAATAGAVVYHKMRNRDHTPDAVTGPPLLPGGNPYDRRDTTTVQYPDFSSFQNDDDGDSYDIRVSGTDAQMKKFINQASIITDSNTNSTIYRGIPNLSSDPFDDIAGSY